MEFDGGEDGKVVLEHELADLEAVAVLALAIGVCSCVAFL